MTLRNFGTSTAAALTLLVATTGCDTLTRTFTRPYDKDDIGLARSDALIDRIERVHVESELAKEHVYAMLDALSAATAEDFSGDPRDAHAACVVAAAAASEQATTYRESIDEMEETSEPFFESWEEDLDTFASAEMRERSRARLEETRMLYSDIRASASPARAGYESFQRRVHDLATFLENDFNSGSLSAIEGDVRALTDQAARIVAKLDACMAASERYIASSTMTTKRPEQRAPEPEPAPETPEGGKETTDSD